MATNSEKNIFASEVLAAISRDNARLSNALLTGFLAMSGDSYDGGLMVVGRAVNGWTDEFRPSHLNTWQAMESYAETVQQSVSGEDKCPMLWVTNCWGRSTGYNTKRSAFWRGIRNVVDCLRIADVAQPGWPSHIVWSNLYKVSPAKGGNPTSQLRRIQLAGCKRLLKLEIATYNPNYLLFLTGTRWAAPFLEDINHTPDDTNEYRYVEQCGTGRADENSQFRYVVACHPQGKPEKEWVREVSEAFDR